MSSSSEHGAASHGATRSTVSRGRAALWLGGALLLGFLIGFLSQFSRLGTARDDLASTTRALNAARLEASLGAAVIEAQSGRFETARQRASDFYSGLQRDLLPTVPSGQEEAVRAILGERDSIITTLARLDPSSAGVLVSVLGRYRETARRLSPDAPDVASDSAR